MDTLIQVLVSGLAQGALYALMGLGLTVIYRATTVLNFMLGEAAMVGAVVSYLAVVQQRLPYAVGLMLGVGAALAVGLVMYRLAYRPLREAPHLTQVLATIAVSFVLIGGARMVIGDERPMPSPFGPGSLRVLGAQVHPQRLLTIAILLLATAIFAWVFNRTKGGLLLRAATETRRGAALVGVDVSRIESVVWAIGNGLGALAGILAAPFVLVSPGMGARPLVMGFAAMTVGGFGTFPGAVAGGLLIGLGEVAGAYYVSSTLGDAAGLGLVFAILLVRPQGLFKKGA